MKEVYLDNQINVVGFKITTNNKTEIGSCANIPKLWSKFYQSKLISKDVKYGVYFNYKDKHFSDYDLLVGVLGDISDRFDYVTICPGKYFVFKKCGEIHKIVVELWKEIWNFFENNNVKRAYKTDFEKYLSDNEVEIYISII